MAWIILFIVSYILFFLLVDLKTLKTNIWCGILAIGLQLLIDTQSISHNQYKIINPVLPLFGSSLFFILGPVLVVATLLAQYHPVNRWLVVINALVFTALYSAQELLLLQVKALIYINWDFWTSVRINAFIMICLSWFCIIVLKKGRCFH